MIWGTELAHIINDPIIPNISKKCAASIIIFLYVFKKGFHEQN
jgi:hypothetical protein